MPFSPLLYAPSIKLLVALFAFWKALLLIIVYLNPSDGYDSSTQIFFLPESSGHQPVAKHPTYANVSTSRIASRLSRWDAIYFAAAAHRGYVHEQEWAFSWGFTTLLRHVTATTRHLVNFVRGETQYASPPPNVIEIVHVGIVLTHLSHIASAVVLYRLVLLTSNATIPASARRHLAFLSAALHVLSPAGVFLSAPYAEASHALLSFLGCYCYISSWLVRVDSTRLTPTAAAIGRTHQRSSDGPSSPPGWIIADLWTVSAGICFGAATLLRSNGIFYGLIFAYDAFLWTVNFAMYFFHGWTIVASVACIGAVTTAGISYWIASELYSEAHFGLSSIIPVATSLLLLLLAGYLLYRQKSWIVGLGKVLEIDLNRQRPASIGATIISGLCIGAGFVWPQYLAYNEFCRANPSSNVPWCSEFPPSIYSSIQSRYWGVGFLKYWTVSNIPLFLLAAPMLCTLIWSAILPFSLDKEGQKAGKNSNAKEITDLANAHILRRLAMPQLIVSILALTTFHVQIINRIASAYPLWYIHLAYAIAKDQGSGSKGKNWTKIGISIMICYSLVQAGLFSAFLPPA